jgi:hypothetical protein
MTFLVERESEIIRYHVLSRQFLHKYFRREKSAIACDCVAIGSLQRMRIRSWHRSRACLLNIAAPHRSDRVQVESVLLR